MNCVLVINFPDGRIRTDVIVIDCTEDFEAIYRSYDNFYWYK